MGAQPLTAARERSVDDATREPPPPQHETSRNALQHDVTLAHTEVDQRLSPIIGLNENRRQLRPRSEPNPRPHAIIPGRKRL
jgi:hypothetical protein